VHCTVLSPGITATEFLAVSGQRLTLYQRLTMSDSAMVVRQGLQAMLAGRPSVVPGFIHALLAWSNRLVPRRLAAAIGYQFMTRR